MFDGVIHCFLGNVVEVCGHGIVVNQHCRFALELARYTEEIFDLAAHSWRADISPWASETTGSRPRASSRVLCDRFVDEAHDLGRVGGFGKLLFGELLIRAPWP